MNRFGLKPLAGLVVAILGVACVGLAGTRGEQVTLYKTMALDNGQVLRPGRYYMEINDNTQLATVKFIQHGQVKATVQSKIDRQTAESGTTTID